MEESAVPAPAPAWQRPVFYTLAVLVIGAAAGLAWVSIVRLPTFTITQELRAVPTPESELSAWFSIDSWFCIIGVVVGLVLGIWSWLWFNRAGWVVTLFAVVGALLAAFTCWRVGLWLGPEPFDVRLARAVPGDRIPISFELRSWPAFLLWAFAAITPVMLFAAFSPDRDEDEDDPAPTMSE